MRKKSQYRKLPVDLSVRNIVISPSPGFCNVSIFGYVFMALEFIGFVLGAGMPINYLRSKNYCSECGYF
ncbi:hypothetical protein JXA84_04180 [candidate division WOR-3 bacterium]|nr:hypothetical protein [candidate division WOR-3 bacterium]